MTSFWITQDISSAFFARAASKVVTTDVVLIEDDINKLKLTEQKVKSKDTIESKKCDSPVRDEVIVCVTYHFIILILGSKP